MWDKRWGYRLISAISNSGATTAFEPQRPARGGVQWWLQCGGPGGLVNERRNRKGTYNIRSIWGEGRELSQMVRFNDLFWRNGA